MTAPQPDTRSLSPTAQQVSECYAVVYPEAPARTKAMQWLNSARKATTGIKGLTSLEFSKAITELVDAGILEPSIEGRKGVAARGPLARHGTITRFCEGAHQRGVYSIILEELASATHYSYHRYHAIPAASLVEQYARQALISNAKVALKRLREQAASMPHLIPQDLKASAAIQKLSYGWDGRTTYETDARTVYQLVGHPSVYDEYGEQFDVMEQPLLLSITNNDQHLRLTIEPKFDGAYYRTLLSRENHRVYVTHFTAAHRRIAEAIPLDGLLIPAI